MNDNQHFLFSHIGKNQKNLRKNNIYSIFSLLQFYLLFWKFWSYALHYTMEWKISQLFEYVVVMYTNSSIEKWILIRECMFIWTDLLDPTLQFKDEIWRDGSRDSFPIFRINPSKYVTKYIVRIINWLILNMSSESLVSNLNFICKISII